MTTKYTKQSVMAEKHFLVCIVGLRDLSCHQLHKPDSAKFLDHCVVPADLLQNSEFVAAPIAGGATLQRACACFLVPVSPTTPHEIVWLDGVLTRLLRQKFIWESE